MELNQLTLFLIQGSQPIMMKWMVFQQIIPNNKVFFNNLIKEKKFISLIFNPNFWPRDNH